MMKEKLVEWGLAGGIEVLGGNLPQSRFVHHKPHMPARTRTWAVAVESQQLTAWATARPQYILTHGKCNSVTTVFREVTSCNLVHRYQSFAEIPASFFQVGLDGVNEWLILKLNFNGVFSTATVLRRNDHHVRYLVGLGNSEGTVQEFACQGSK
jgi:hypothetical protein